MAMLMTNEVFARTWGERAGPAPQAEYWPTLIAGTKAVHPDFLFVAEAYWDMEWALQQQGFDFCYDKRLYDRLAHESAESVRGHLQADLGYQERLIRFIENHDEPRAAATFGHRARRGRPRSSCPRCRGRASTTTASSRAGARGSRSSSAGDRTSRPTAICVRSTHGCCARWTRLTCATATGACAPAKAGRTTTPPASWSRGAGRTRTHATSWSSTSPMPRRRRAYACRGTTWRGAAWQLTDRLDGEQLRARRRRDRRRRPVRGPRRVGVVLLRVYELTRSHQQT